MSGGGDFKIYNGDKELDKEIKEKDLCHRD